MHWSEYRTDTSLPPREQVRCALKSGAFKQALGKLQDDDAFCCHGVATIIAEQNGVEVVRGADGQLLGGHPRVAVINWVDLDEQAVDARIEWNDSVRMTLAQIGEDY